MNESIIISAGITCMVMVEAWTYGATPSKHSVVDPETFCEGERGRGGLGEGEGLMIIMRWAWLIVMACYVICEQC